MLRKFSQDPNARYFLAYCISYAGYGACFNGIGPLIPYLADKYQIQETQYSFLFLNRATGFIVGTLMVKTVKRFLNFHQILMLTSALVFVSFIAFTMSSTVFLEGFFYFLTSIFCSILEVVLNVSILVTHTGENQEFFMQISHGMFGVGGLIAPLIVVVFEEYALIATGFIIFMVIPAYYSLPTPEEHQQIVAAELLNAGDVKEEVKRVTEHIRHSHHQSNELIQQEKSIVYWISFLFFVYIGQEVAFGGWISSYAALTGIARKSEATQFSEYFWVFMTLFRFIAAYIPMRPSQKIKICLIAQVSTISAVIVMTVAGLQSSAVYVASIGMGVTFSAIFGLLFVLPSEFGVTVTTEQCSAFLMYGEVGEGVISMAVGYLMGWFGPLMLYISILACGTVLLLGCNKVLSLLAKESKEQELMKLDSNKSSLSSPRKPQRIET